MYRITNCDKKQEKRQYLQSTLGNVFIWQKKEFWVKAFEYECKGDSFEAMIQIANFMANIKIDMSKALEYIHEITLTHPFPVFIPHLIHL